MISEALVKANPVFHFEEAIISPDKYLKLMHDDLLNVIRKSKDPRLKESADLIKRIDTRDLFKMVGEASIHKSNRAKVTAEAICSDELDPSDLHVLFFKLDWGNGEEYPLDRINFFDSHDTTKLCSLTLFEAHQYRPQQCYDYRIRVFVRDAAKKAAARRAFEAFMRKNDKSLMYMVPENGQKPITTVKSFAERS
jgi:deoxynucleoside triphosphate triphosphohydrolase SAMHD1